MVNREVLFFYVARGKPKPSKRLLVQMNSQDPFFKIRPTKRSNPEARTTLDSIHRSHLEKLIDENKSIESVRSDLQSLKEQHDDSTNDIEKVKYEREMKDIENKLIELTGEKNVFEYFLETGPILYEYYDIQEKINRGIEVKQTKQGKSQPGSIWAALENAAEKTDEVGGVINKGGSETLARSSLLNKYLQKIDPEHAKETAVLNQLQDTYGKCDECNCEMIFSTNEAVFSCPECGFQEFILIDSDKPSYKDPPREISYYAYKRINHFNEWLAQFQAKESTEIPKEVYDSIIAELKKERINDLSSLNRSKIREILKKLKMNKYYEHTPHITNRLNGQNAPVMTRETEEKLRHMFIEIQPSFQKHCPKDRSNFLSYSYVLYKFCELLDLDEYLHCFPLLKNKDKLYAQDKIWQNICIDLKWQFIRSI
jgi:Zn finger protein HypA/HybF involved in hydrogenase expression